MKLKNLLGDEDCWVEYRTFFTDGSDMLQGYCLWNGKELKPLDGDNYSIEDEIIKYELDPAGDLIVWIKSKWISG